MSLKNIVLSHNDDDNDDDGDNDDSDDSNNLFSIPEIHQSGYRTATNTLELTHQHLLTPKIHEHYTISG
jgi:hypothetical protein